MLWFDVVKKLDFILQEGEGGENHIALVKNIFDRIFSSGECYEAVFILLDHNIEQIVQTPWIIESLLKMAKRDRESRNIVLKPLERICRNSK